MENSTVVMLGSSYVGADREKMGPGRRVVAAGVAVEVAVCRSVGAVRPGERAGADGRRSAQYTHGGRTLFHPSADSAYRRGTSLGDTPHSPTKAREMWSEHKTAVPCVLIERRAGDLIFSLQPESAIPCCRRQPQPGNANWPHVCGMGPIPSKW